MSARFLLFPLALVTLSACTALVPYSLPEGAPAGRILVTNRHDLPFEGILDDQFFLGVFQPGSEVMLQVGAGSHRIRFQAWIPWESEDRSLVWDRDLRVGPDTLQRLQIPAEDRVFTRVPRGVNLGDLEGTFFSAPPPR